MTTGTELTENTEAVGTIDLTPTWSGLVQHMMLVMEGGSAEGRAGIRTEFYRMASAADKWNELQVANREAVAKVMG